MSLPYGFSEHTPHDIAMIDPCPTACAFFDLVESGEVQGDHGDDILEMQDSAIAVVTLEGHGFSPGSTIHGMSRNGIPGYVLIWRHDEVGQCVEMFCAYDEWLCVLSNLSYDPQ